MFDRHSSLLTIWSEFLKTSEIVPAILFWQLVHGGECLRVIFCDLCAMIHLARNYLQFVGDD